MLPNCPVHSSDKPSNKLCIPQVTYSSVPKAAGGPVLRSPAGQLLFTNQQLRQTLQQPETLVNSVSFKSLGLFPGTAEQSATIETLSGSMYKVDTDGKNISIYKFMLIRSLWSLHSVLSGSSLTHGASYFADYSPACKAVRHQAWARKRRTYF